MNEKELWKLAEEHGLLTMVDDKPLWFDADLTNFAAALRTRLVGDGKPIGEVAELKRLKELAREVIIEGGMFGIHHQALRAYLEEHK